MCQSCEGRGFFSRLGSSPDLKMELWRHWKKKGWEVEELSKAYRLDSTRLRKVLKDIDKLMEVRLQEMLNGI